MRAADRLVIQAAAGRLVIGITTALEVEPVDVRVLAVRPALRAAELHGLYTRDHGRRPEIRVWMRTLAHKRVVAFRTFLRTLLHEVCHHLDYTLLALPESFHTQGFFNRESSLFKQLVPELVRPPRALGPIESDLRLADPTLLDARGKFFLQVESPSSVLICPNCDAKHRGVLITDPTTLPTQLTAATCRRTQRRGAHRQDRNADQRRA